MVLRNHPQSFSGLHWQRRTSQKCQPFCAKERSPGSQRSDKEETTRSNQGKRGAYELSESEAKTVLKKWSSALSRACSRHRSNRYLRRMSTCHKVRQSEAWWRSGDDTVWRQSLSGTVKKGNKASAASRCRKKLDSMKHSSKTCKKKIARS